MTDGKKLFLSVGTSAQIEAFKAAGQEIVHDAVSAGQHVVAVIKASPIGGQIVDAIQTMVSGKNPDGTPMSGVQKGERVLADAVPLIAGFAADGGVSLVTSAENTAREVVQSLYNDTVGAAKDAADAATAGETAPAS